MNINTLKQNWFYPVIAIFFFGLLLFSPLSGTYEPDSLYHFSISRISAEQGLIRSLPQLEDIGWSSYFPEKEFLFHQLTKWGYIIAGDQGVKLVSHFLGTLILLLLVYIGETLSSRKVSFSITLLMLLNASFFLRLTMIRPHLGGMLFALVILLGLMKKSRVITAIGFFLFPLFYHAFYIPLIFLAAFSLTNRSSNFKFLLTYALLPLACGVLVNPYFPSTLMMTWLGIRIALSTSQSTNLGTEALPLGVFGSLEAIGHIVILTLALFAICRKCFKPESNTAFLWLITLVLIVCFFFSPRTIEYLIPLSTLLFISTVPTLTRVNKQYYMFLCLILLSVNIRYTGTLFKSHDELAKYYGRVEQLISHLPRTGNEKVFNCEWDFGSLILYHRPNLKMVDLLDPNFLYLHNPDLAKLRDKMLKQPAKDYHSMMINLFKANYLLCQNPLVISSIKNDPRFELMSESVSPHIYLYRILE